MAFKKHWALDVWEIELVLLRLVPVHESQWGEKLLQNYTAAIYSPLPQCFIYSTSVHCERAAAWNCNHSKRQQSVSLESEIVFGGLHRTSNSVLPKTCRVSPWRSSIINLQQCQERRKCHGKAHHSCWLCFHLMLREGPACPGKRIDE